MEKHVPQTIVKGPAESGGLDTFIKMGREWGPIVATMIMAVMNYKMSNQVGEQQKTINELTEKVNQLEKGVIANFQNMKSLMERFETPQPTHFAPKESQQQPVQEDDTDDLDSEMDDYLKEELTVIHEERNGSRVEEVSDSTPIVEDEET